MVEEGRYNAHIANYVDQREVSTQCFVIWSSLIFVRLLQSNTCNSQHDAVLRANTHRKENYLASGTGLTLCARHALIRKNGVGDLQKRERCVLLSVFA
jgi:Kyakuja-Dileera-Zisupton transposase